MIGPRDAHRGTHWGRKVPPVSRRALHYAGGLLLDDARCCCCFVSRLSLPTRHVSPAPCLATFLHRRQSCPGVVRFPHAVRACMARDIEMADRGKPTGEAPEETDYRPVNWRRVFLTPKYIRTSFHFLEESFFFFFWRRDTDPSSVAHHRHRHPHLHHLHHRPPRRGRRETPPLLRETARPARRLAHPHRHPLRHLLPAALRARDRRAAVRCRLGPLDRLCHRRGGHFSRREYVSPLPSSSPGTNTVQSERGTPSSTRSADARPSSSAPTSTTAPSPASPATAASGSSS